MALEVGGIFARLGAQFDGSPFDRFDRREAESRRRAAKPIEQDLQGNLDASDFEAFDSATESARRQATKPVVVDVGANIDAADFDEYDRKVAQARRKAATPVAVELGAAVDASDFDDFEHRVDVARTKATNAIAVDLGADVDPAGFVAFDGKIAAAKRHPKIKVEAGLDVDDAGFEAFDRKVAARRRDANGRFIPASAPAPDTPSLGPSVDEGSLSVLARLRAGINGVAESVSAAAGGVGGFGGQLGRLGQFGGAAAGGLAILVPVVVGLAGAAVAAAGSLAAAAAGVGALSVGSAAAAGPIAAVAGAVAARFGAIKDAYAAVEQQQDQAGATAQASAQQQRQAAQTIAAAQQALGDARRTGADQVAAAEQALGDARRTGAARIADAEEALTTSREQGAEQVADAEQAVTAARADGARTIADAEEALRDARTAGADAIEDAEDRLGSARQAATKSIAAAERQLGDAREQGAAQVADAEQALSDVRRQGAANVQAADEALAGAQRDARAAQQALTDARARAREELYNLAEASRDAKDAEEGAQISLQRSLERLSRVQADPKATLLDIREANYAVKQARDGVEDAAVARRRADEDAAKGTETVTAARDALAAANGEVTKAEQGVRSAQSDSVRAITAAQAAIGKARADAAESESDAQRELAEARKAGAATIREANTALADARTDAAARIQDAEERLTDSRVKSAAAVEQAQDTLSDAQRTASRANVAAARAVSEAQADAARTTTRAQAAVGKATEDSQRQQVRAAAAVRAAQAAAADALASQSAGADAAAAKLAKLTDTERRLLARFRGFSGSLTRIFRPATDAIFGSVDGALGRIEPLVERYRGTFTSVGRSIGGLVTSASRSLTGPEWTRALDSFAGTARRIVGPIGRAVGSAVNAARNIAEAAQPYVVELADGIERFFSRLESKTRDVTNVRRVIGQLVDSTRSWMRLIGAVGGLLVTVFGGGKRQGDSLVDSLTRATKRLDNFLKTKEGRAEMLRFFRNAADTAKSFFGVLGDVVKWVVRTANALIDFNRQGNRALTSIEDWLKTFATTVKNTFRNAAVDIVGLLTTIMGATSTTLTALGHLPGVGGKFKRLAKEIDTARDKLDGWRDSVKKAGKQEAWANEVERQSHRVGNLKDDLSRLRKGSDEYKEKQKELRSETKKLNEKLSDGQTAGHKMSKGVAEAALSAGDAATASVIAGGNIAEGFNELAKQFGIKSVTYKTSRAKVPKGRAPNAGSAHGAPPALAVGGIPNPGSGTADDHVLVDPNGNPVALMSGTEGVLNGPQMPIVDTALRVAHAVGALPFDGLDALWGAGFRHNTGGRLGTDQRTIPAFAGGGGFSAIPGSPGEEAATSILSKIAAVKRRFPALAVTDAYDRDGSAGHKSPGHNVTGTAVDFAGPDRVMDAAVKSLVAAGYLVGYDGRFGSAAWPGHGPTSVAGGNAHLHVEFGGKGGAIKGGTAEVAPKLPAVKIAGPGPMGDLINAAAARLTRAGQRKLDAAASDALGTAAPGGGGSGSAGTAQVRAWARTALSRPGSPFPPTPANIRALVGRIMQESGGNPGITNTWDSNAQAGDPSIGLAQVIGSTFARYRDRKLPNNRRNPIANLAAALNYMKARYGRVVGANGQGYNRGGRLRRFAGGGLLGAGIRAFAGGGPLAGLVTAAATSGVPALAGGGKASRKKRGLKDRLDDTYDVAAGDLRTLNRPQNDRIAAYDARLSEVDYAGKDYAQQERRNDQTEEVLIDDETGAVNTKDVQRRARELAALLAIRRKVRSRLQSAQRIAVRTISTYGTIINRLERARAAARRSKSKRRKSAIASYTASINSYRENRSEWQTKNRDLIYDIGDAVLDVKSLAAERAEVLGTRAVAQEPAEQGTAYLEEGDVSTGDSGSGGPAIDAGSDSSPADSSSDGAAAEQAAPDPAAVATAALQQFASFQSARADLFGSFGANFVAAGAGGGMMASVGAQAAGTRYFGGDTGGTDGGTIAGAGGIRGGTTIENLNMTFTAPQQQDAHLMAANFMHEIQA